MCKWIFFVLMMVLLGINGMIFWKSRGGETKSNLCQITCSLKLPGGNGAVVLPGALVVLM